MPATQNPEEDALLDAFPDPIIVALADGRVTGINLAAEQLFGERSTDEPAPHVRELLPFVPEEPLGAVRRKSWQGLVTDRTGRERRVEVNRAILENRRGPHRYLYVLHDISRTVESNWWREQILYTLAHEVGGSFTVLRNAFELMDPGEPEGDTSHLIRTAQVTIQKVEMLMEDLLAAGSIRGGRFQVNPRPVRLEELAREAADAVTPETAARAQEIQLSLPKAEVWVGADPSYTSRVLFNLLRNASKYSPGGAIIRVIARVTKNGWVRISVEDRGKGIPPEELRWVFERFYRVKPGSPEAGVGLGLAIARGIVQAHGGRMGVRSRLGKGTTVWFTLAVVDPPEPLTDEPGEPAPSAPGDDAGSRPPRPQGIRAPGRRSDVYRWSV
jgi:signal transduction histidine kinase